jgi:formamidopyrimidine-DNA glycosylase
MPELPEVETVRAGLAQALTGKTIRKVILRRKNLRLPITPRLAGRVEGRRILSIERRAKYLFFRLDNENVILAHLGMSGRMVVRPSLPVQFDTHDHVVLTFDDDSAFIFNDARRFGIFLLVEEKKLALHPLLKNVGPEPFDNTFNAKTLAAGLKKRKGPIKTTLMDQKLVAGIGNIYASEILHLAEIDPTKAAYRYASSAARLITATRKVLKDAIRSGGSTLRDYVRATGDPGYFQHRFAVYERGGEPCIKCKTKIRHITQAGRSTYYCPRCQK